MTSVSLAESPQVEVSGIGQGFAYGEGYVSDAMEVLGEFFEYAVHDYGAEGDEVADLFCMSPISKEFAKGNPRYICGMSGPELFCELNEERGGEEQPLPSRRAEHSTEYWVGWAAAYAQWKLDISFALLFGLVPYDEFVQFCHPQHEAGEERFCAIVEERLRGYAGSTNLARLRQAVGITQRELAHRSGVGLRSIQMYEQRNKDINKAQVRTVYQLARALYCPIESLLEPALPSER